MADNGARATRPAIRASRIAPTQPAIRAKRRSDPVSISARSAAAAAAPPSACALVRTTTATVAKTAAPRAVRPRPSAIHATGAANRPSAKPIRTKARRLSAWAAGPISPRRPSGQPVSTMAALRQSRNQPAPSGGPSPRLSRDRPSQASGSSPRSPPRLSVFIAPKPPENPLRFLLAGAAGRLRQAYNLSRRLPTGPDRQYGPAPVIPSAIRRSAGSGRVPAPSGRSAGIPR